MLTKVLLTGFAALALAVPTFGQTAAPTEQTPAATAQPAAEVLTLDDAIATAVVHSPGLATARERVLRSENVVEEARAAGRFQVNLNGRYSRTSPTSSTTFPGPDGPVTIGGNASQTSASAQITQPIDISGRIRLGRELAGLQLDIQGYNEAQTLRQLIVDVKNAYYDVLRSEANVDVAQSSLTVNEERLRIARALFDAGASPRFDVTSAEVDVANRQQTLIGALSVLEIAQGALNRTIGIEVTRPFTLVDQPATTTAVTVDVVASIARALASRPEVEQSRLSIALADRTVNFAQTETKPTLDLFAQTNWANEATGFSSDNTTLTYGASVNWSIWNSGATRARVGQARNDAQIARRGLDNTTLGIEQEVRSSANVVMESSKRVETSERNVALAQEALRLAGVRYQEGVSTQVEVSQAEDNYTQARSNAVSAKYNYLTALAALERATTNQPEYAVIAGTPSSPSLNSGAKLAPPVTALAPVSPKIVEPKFPYPSDVVTPAVDIPGVDGQTATPQGASK